MHKPKSFRQLVGEVLLIVVSILIAFGIDTTWAQWKQSQEEQRILITLHDEFLSNQSRLLANMDYTKDINAALVRLLSEAALEEPKLGMDSLDYFIGATCWTSIQVPFGMSAIETVTFGGELSLISNEELRQRISGWRLEVSGLLNIVNQDYDANFWMTFMRENTYMPQISNAITIVPGSREPNYGENIPQIPQTVDHRKLLTNRQFQNVLVHRKWIQDDILNAYYSIQPKLDLMIKLVGKEIRQ